MRRRAFHLLALALAVAAAPAVASAQPTTILVQGRTLRGDSLPSVLVTPTGDLLLTAQLRLAASATLFRDGDVVAIGADGGGGATYDPVMADQPAFAVAALASARGDDLRLFDPQTRTFGAVPIAGGASLTSLLDTPGSYAVISAPSLAQRRAARLVSLPHPCGGSLADPTDTAAATATATNPPPATFTAVPSPTPPPPATVTAVATATPSSRGSATPTLPPGTTPTPTSATVAFAPPSGDALALRPGSVVAADFNHDGRADLAVAAAATAEIRLRLGNGAGGFDNGGSVTLPAGVGSLSYVAAGDLDGDGDADVLAADPSGNQLLAALGDGAGGIAAGPAAPLAGSPSRVALHDLTGDGRLDALATVGNGVAVLINTGGATLELDRVLRTGESPADIALMEASGDGASDLVAALSTGVFIFAGDGAGDFASGHTLSADPAQALAVADFTGDGRADLAVVSGAAIAVYPGAPAGLAGPPLTTPLSAGDQLYTADLNGDGLVDLVVLNGGAGPRSVAAGLSGPGTGAIVLQGSGDGHFTEVGMIESDGVGLAVADLDGDRLPEVIVAAADEAALFIAANSTATAITPGDVDMDGRIDGLDQARLAAEIFDGDGDAAMSSGGGTLRSGAAADVNGDGSIGAADLCALLPLR